MSGVPQRLPVSLTYSHILSTDVIPSDPFRRKKPVIFFFLGDVRSYIILKLYFDLRILHQTSSRGCRFAKSLGHQTFQTLRRKSSSGSAISSTSIVCWPPGLAVAADRELSRAVCAEGRASSDQCLRGPPGAWGLTHAFRRRDARLLFCLPGDASAQPWCCLASDDSGSIVHTCARAS